jgi:hypothetical protein
MARRWGMGHFTLQFEALLHRPQGEASDQRSTASASWLGALLTALLLAGTAAQEARSQDGEIQLDVANLFFELNDTDGDLGLHALVDGEPWKLLEIEVPDERVILFVRGTGPLARQGMTELSFESAEPSFDELPPEEFFERFPEGLYEISAQTLESEELESAAELEHLLPAAPDNITVNGEGVPEDCEEDDPPAVEPPVLISWDPVTLSHPEIGRTDEPVEVLKYQLVVEREEPDLLVYSVDLPPNLTTMTIPEEFTALGEEFKLEVLVSEANGNQTAVESCFAVQ